MEFVRTQLQRLQEHLVDFYRPQVQQALLDSQRIILKRGITQDQANEEEHAKKRVKESENVGTLFGLPAEILKDNVFLSFLSFDDISSLEATCPYVYTTLSSRSLPHVIRVERLPTKMGYEPWEEACFATVSQVQKFRFLLRTASHGVVDVFFILSNAVWDEFHTDRLHPSCRPLAEFPKETEIAVIVKRKSSSSASDLFFMRSDLANMGCTCQNVGCMWRQGFQVEGLETSTDSENSDLTQEDIEIPHQAEHNLRAALSCLFACAKYVYEISDDDQIAYPSPAYVMKRLPEALRQFFPAEVVVDEFSPDRRTNVEWEYRSAPADSDEWHDYIGPDLPGNIREFELDELPWYKNHNSDTPGNDSGTASEQSDDDPFPLWL